jgi:streptogramin lyase
MFTRAIVAMLAVMCLGVSAAARVCPPPPPTGTGDYVDDCGDVFRIECPAQDRVLTGFRAWVEGQLGIITALHGVVGCPKITAFNLTTSYRDLRIGKVDIARDTAFLISSELDRAGEGLQFSNEYQGEDLRIVGYPQALGYQFSHRVEPNVPPLRPLLTTLPDAERLELERRGSPDVGQTILSLSGAIQNGYSGAPILTWEGRVIGVANGGLRSGSVDIGWAMPIGQMRWENAQMRQNELTKLSGGKPSALFGAQASPRSTLPTLYLTDGGNNIGRIYEVRDGRLREIYVRPRGRLYSVAIAPDGAFYFSNANDYEIYRLDKGREVKAYTHSTYTRDIEFDVKGRLYFSEAKGAGGDGIIYRLQNGRAIPHFKVRLSDVGGFWAGDFAFDGKGTLWLSNGNRIPASLYKVEKGQLQRMFTAATSIMGFTFTADGDLLYADHRQRIQRIELPGFLTSEAVHAPNIKWMTDVAVFGVRKVTMTPGALPSVFSR